LSIDDLCFPADCCGVSREDVGGGACKKGVTVEGVSERLQKGWQEKGRLGLDYDQGDCV
jgi:hypothetical protein